MESVLHSMRYSSLIEFIVAYIVNMSPDIVLDDLTRLGVYVWTCIFKFMDMSGHAFIDGV